jgi:hypothetical protein
VVAAGIKCGAQLHGPEEGGRPPFDPVLMFEILVIQATNNLSDERALINDRLLFMRFLGLGQPVCPALLVIMTLLVAHSN